MKKCMVLAGVTLLCGIAQLITPQEAVARAPSTAFVQNIRYSATSEYTRVIVELDSESPYVQARLTGPDRVYFDISNASLRPDFLNRAMVVGNEFLQRVRVAQNQSDVVRIVLNIAPEAKCITSELHNPFRLVVNIYGPPGIKTGVRPLPQAAKLHPEEIGPKGSSKEISDGVRPSLQAAKPLVQPAVEELSQPQPYPPAASVTVNSRAQATAGAFIQRIQYRVAGDHTRVVIDLDASARYEKARLSSPDRVYFDISNTRLSREFVNPKTAGGAPFLKQIRVAPNRSDMVRVVLDVAGAPEYMVSELHDPFRIVVDLYGPAGTNPGPNSIRPRQAEIGPRGFPGQDPAGGQVARETRDSLSAVDVNTASAPVSVAGSGTHEDVLTEASLPPLEVAAIILPRQTFAQTQLLNKTVWPPADADGGEEELPLGKILPLTINGTFSTGYYNSFSRGGSNQNRSINFMPAGASFDINGYYLKPDLLNYSIQPEFYAGAQASDAGFEGGNGIRMRVTALPKGVVPLTFRYSNVQLKDAYFGSLTQVSSYTLNNRNKDLGLTTGLNMAGLPAMTFDWGLNSVQSESFSPAIPDYASRSNHLNLNCADKRWGWDFQCFAGRQQQTSGLFTPLSEGPNSSPLSQKGTQFRGSARRTLLGDAELYIDGGTQNMSNTVLGQPIDLTTRYASANLRMFQKRKWKTSLGAGYNSNISGLLMSQLIGGLGSNGSVAPDQNVLGRLQRTTSYLNFNGLTSVELPRGFGFYGGADRTAVYTDRSKELSSNYFTTTSGATYTRSFGWGSLSGEYGRSFGFGSVTGQTGMIIGQSYVFTAQPGNPDGLQFDLSIRGNTQTVHNDVPTRDHSFASDAGVRFNLAGRFRAQLGGGWQRSAFSNHRNDSLTTGYTGRAGIEHPRFQFNASLNSSAGNSFQSYDQLLSGLASSSAFLTPLHMDPSDFRGVTFSLHVIPVQRLEFSALSIPGRCSIWKASWPTILRLLMCLRPIIFAGCSLPPDISDQPRATRIFWRFIPKRSGAASIYACRGQLKSYDVLSPHFYPVVPHCGYPGTAAAPASRFFVSQG
jgi:hypothetical protein